MVYASFVDEEIIHRPHLNSLVLGIMGDGVISGCEVTEGTADKDIDIAAGTVRIDGTDVAVAADTLTVADNTSGNPRKDLVVVDSTGTVSIQQGTPAAASPVGNKGKFTESPEPPDIPLGKVPIAEIWVPDDFVDIDTTRSQAEAALPAIHGWIIDRRIRVPTHDMMSNLPWSVAGHTIDTDVDFNSHKIYLDKANLPNTYIWEDGTNPVLNFDTGDLLVYDISANQFLFKIGGATELSLSSTELKLEGVKLNTNSQLILIDTAYKFGLDGGKPRIWFDAGDAIIYDRTNNVHDFYVGGAKQVSIGLGEIDFHNKNLNDVASIDGGGNYVIFHDDIALGVDGSEGQNLRVFTTTSGRYAVYTGYGFYAYGSQSFFFQHMGTGSLNYQTKDTSDVSKNRLIIN
ncbi:MAG: hypothetical protein ACTSPB_25975, partial [Candidatus Thorarchaeota archaeon]